MIFACVTRASPVPIVLSSLARMIALATVHALTGFAPASSRGTRPTVRSPCARTIAPSTVFATKPRVCALVTPGTRAWTALTSTVPVAQRVLRMVRATLPRASALARAITKARPASVASAPPTATAVVSAFAIQGSVFVIPRTWARRVSCESAPTVVLDTAPVRRAVVSVTVTSCGARRTAVERFAQARRTVLFVPTTVFATARTRCAIVTRAGRGMIAPSSPARNVPTIAVVPQRAGALMASATASTVGPAHRVRYRRSLVRKWTDARVQTTANALKGTATALTGGLARRAMCQRSRVAPGTAQATGFASTVFASVTSFSPVRRAICCGAPTTAPATVCATQMRHAVATRDILRLRIVPRAPTLSAPSASTAIATTLLGSACVTRGMRA